MFVSQGATELKEIGNDHYNRRNFQEAKLAYDHAACILHLPTTSTQFIPAAYIDQFQALFCSLYADFAAAYLGLENYEDAFAFCSKSLLVKETAPVYLQRARLHRGLLLNDFQAAARLDKTVNFDAQDLVEMVAADYGRDAGGHVRYAWQARWAAGGVQSELQDAMKKLFVQDAARGQVGWGELRAHPGPDSDLRWAELSDPDEDTRNHCFILFCEAIQMLLKPDFADWMGWFCAYEWLVELHSLGFQLHPEGPVKAGQFLITFCRGCLADCAAKGIQLLNEAADGKHNHDLCAAMMDGSLGGGVSCILDLESVKLARSRAILFLLQFRHEFKLITSHVYLIVALADADLIRASFVVVPIMRRDGNILIIACLFPL